MLLVSHLLLLVMSTCWLVSGQGDVPTVPCYGPDCSVTKPPTESTAESATSTTTPTTTPLPGNIQRTVVFIYKSTQNGQDLFIRGGIDETIVRPECKNDESAETSSCAISIKVNSLGMGEPWAGYDAWRIGDTKLDWFGPQTGQGTYLNNPAFGTPLAWTTSNSLKPQYQELNTWGDHNWMVDFNMDCSETVDGWFDLKAYLTNFASGWEADIVQSTCTGDGATVSPPYSGTKNHMARCGFINRFNFGSGGCEIITFKSDDQKILS